jgi:hypothetical protein
VSWSPGSPGDAVQKRRIAEVDTEKAVVEIESMFSGVVERLLVATGPGGMGTMLAVIPFRGH